MRSINPELKDLVRSENLSEKSSEISSENSSEKLNRKFVRLKLRQKIFIKKIRQKDSSKFFINPKEPQGTKNDTKIILKKYQCLGLGKVSVQGVVTLGGHFATICLEVDVYEAFFLH